MKPRLDIKLYPGSDPNVRDVVLQNQINVGHNQVWVDLSIINSVDLNHAVWHQCQHIIVYDWFQAMRFVGPAMVQAVADLQRIAPVTWISTHKIETQQVNVQRWDFLWNRAKSAYLQHVLGWNQGPYHKNFEQYPIHWQQRSKKYLQLYARPEPCRDQLSALVRPYDGYWSDLGQGIFLPYNVGDIHSGHFTALPHRRFLDDTYISCQVESTHFSGLAVGFTEKTYDHLIQGRLVLNFGPQNFYKTLEHDGWALPQGVDLTWDSTEDDSLRFKFYCQMLKAILELDVADIHELFVLNRQTVTHNHNQLHTRPLDQLILPCA